MISISSGAILRAALFSLLLLSTLNPANAALSEEDYFEELGRIPANYKVFGTVCEEMARIDLEEEYHRDFYDIKVGIEYRNANRTVGELDVIIFRRSDEEAIMVAEVKCWRNFQGALKKANRQLGRFQNNSGNENIRFIGRENGVQEYHWTQFDELTNYQKISQLGGREAGFDRTLTLDIAAIKRLHGRLMQCQESGRCSRPN